MDSLNSSRGHRWYIINTKMNTIWLKSKYIVIDINQDQWLKILQLSMNNFIEFYIYKIFVY